MVCRKLNLSSAYNGIILILKATYYTAYSLKAEFLLAGFPQRACERWDMSVSVNWEWSDCSTDIDVGLFLFFFRVAVVSKSFEGQTDKTEEWYGTQYKQESISDEVIKVSYSSLSPKQLDCLFSLLLSQQLVLNYQNWLTFKQFVMFFLFILHLSHRFLQLQCLL